MPAWVIVEVFQLSLLISKSLPDDRVARLRRLLGSLKFRRQLKQVLAALLATHSDVAPRMRVDITV